MEKEFNLSDEEVEWWDTDSYYYGSDIKEFIRLDTQLIKDFNDGKMTYNFLMNERNKLLGEKFA